jgi:predicted DNA-binding transcriptional regulator YafY
MRGTQLARQWKIIRIMESRNTGILATDLSTELDVPLRTLYRDLETIQEAGFPVYSEQSGKNSYWKLLETFKKEFPVPLTATELMALHMSRDLLTVLEGTVFHDSIETLFAKIKTLLSPQTLEYLENISGTIGMKFGACKNLAQCKDAVEAISEAVAKRNRISILYRAVSTGREDFRKVDPYQVSVMNGGFYLIGHCHLRDSIRTFAVDRIRNYLILDETYEIPKTFDIDDYLQSAFHIMTGDPKRVKIVFDSGAAHVISERIWHPTQEIRDRNDGSVELTLSVPINYEIISWILGFGSKARVLQPESLRKRIAEELQRAADNYYAATKISIAHTKKSSARLS